MRRLKALESFDKSLPESRWKGFLTSCAPFCKPVEEPGFSLYNEVINPSEGGIFMNRLASAVRSLAQAGGSFYLYDESSIFRHIDLLKETFPQAQFLYSIKCNPNPHVIQSVCSRGLGADTASFGEVLAAEKAGLSPDQIYYSAPGKTSEDIRRAMSRSTLIADSTGELLRIQAAAGESGQILHAGVRINPDFSFGGGPGSSSKFGIDESQLYEFLAETPLKNVVIGGIHVHLKSQELRSEVLAEYYRNMFHLAETFEEKTGFPLKFLNLGSGMGIPYSPDDRPLDLEALKETTAELFAGFHASHPDTAILIETGRFAVGKSGYYVTRVLDRKISRGKTYLILENTLNGFLRPVLARLICRYSPDPSPEGCEPLFTCRDECGIMTFKEEPPSEQVTLAGNLCTAADVIAEDILLPHLEPGDIIAVTNAGSYAAALTPFQFSSQEKPAEFFLTEEGKILS